MKCALYARVSTEEQVKKYSIPAQLDLLRSFAGINSYKIFKEYVDKGISGTTSDRPQLKELFKDAERGYFQIILVYRIDRFFRSTLNLLSAVDKLQKIGVSFRSVTEPFDTSTPLGSFMISLLGSVAQLERDTFVERSKMGIARSVKEGHYMASTPLYGYDYNPITKKLEINSNEAHIVRLIFKLYQEPFSSQAKIAAKLNELNHRGKRGAKWAPSQLQRILTQPGYYGRWSYNTGSERITIDIPAIIDKKLFDNTQKLLKKRKSYPNTRRPHDYLLLKLLYCGECGRRMGMARIKRKDKTYTNYYYCFEYKYKKGCSIGHVRKERVDSLVWQEIKKYIKEPTTIRYILHKGKQDKNKLESSKRQLIKIVNKIERLELQNEKILDLYRKDTITEEELIHQRQKITQEKQILDQQKMEIKLQIEGQKYLEERLGTLEKFIGKIKDKIDNLDFKRKRKIIELLINKISLYKDGGISMEIILPDSVLGINYKEVVPVV